jgi:hypothetical protein
MEQEFEDYLRKKKIDPEAFRMNEPETYVSFRDQFLHIHPDSFTMQKLYLINLLRRKYYFQNEVAAPAGSVKAKAKPVVRKPSSAGKATESSKASKPLVKPKTSKPVVPPKGKAEEEQASSSTETTKKPKVKPKIRPKVKSKTTDTEETKKEKTSRTKPVIKKPVMKPKIKPAGDSKKEDPEEKSTPKKSKPVIKPRIPKKDQ